LYVALFIGFSGVLSAQDVEYGKASYYADEFQGRKTASGEVYHKDSLTAAHRSIPFGTRVKLTNVKNNKSVIVRINDRGPHIPGRIIDLSRKAMMMLKGIDAGVIEITLEVVERKPED